MDARGRETEDRESVFNGDSVWAWECEKVPEVDGSNGCNMYLMPLNCTLKNVTMVNFFFNS